MSNRAAPWDAVSDRYDTWVISPFAPAVQSPLRGDLKRLLASWRRGGVAQRKVVLDVGCGRGDGLALLAGTVGTVVGLDVSPRLLDLAGRWLGARGIAASRYPHRGGLARLARELHAGGAPRAVLLEADMGALAPLGKSADLVLAISSIAPPRAADVDRLFANVVACLKPGGTFMAVFASRDAFQYLTALAERRGTALPDIGHVDAQGIFHEDGDRQKFYLPEEIDALYASHGLRVETRTKVLYPWRLMRRFGWGHFPGRPRLWDWYVRATIPSRPPRRAPRAAVPRARRRA